MGALACRAPGFVVKNIIAGVQDAKARDARGYRLQQLQVLAGEVLVLRL
jgi:hypothetical protein